MRLYDPQRWRVYAAEWTVFHDTKTRRLNVRYRSLREARVLARRIANSWWWVYECNGSPEVIVEYGRGDYAYVQDTGETCWVVLPRWSWNRAHLFHELAHGASRCGRQDHGPLFAKRLIEIHETFGSMRQAQQLREAFKLEGVKVAR